MTPQATYSNLKLLMIRHTRREAGIQCQGWQLRYLPVAWIPAMPPVQAGGRLCRNDEAGRGSGDHMERL